MHIPNPILMACLAQSTSRLIETTARSDASQGSRGRKDANKGTGGKAAAFNIGRQRGWCITVREGQGRLSKGRDYEGLQQRD